MKQNRRSFLRMAGGAGALMVANPSMAFSGKVKQTKITILHTNDLHSQIDAYDENHPKYPNMGGFARRAALVAQVRDREEHVLLLDAGDLFQGSPYYNFFKGELEVKLMNQMQYDAVTLGNHEFDNGEAMLFEQFVKANHPVLCANYVFEKQGWRDLVQPFILKQYDDVTIGIMGLSINPKGLIADDNFKGIVYKDAIETANDLALQLKETEGCDFVIALTHLGIDSDTELAQASQHIDLIIGGHSHTFLKEPLLVPNKQGQDVLINQMGWAGVYLGRIDLFMTNGQSKIKSQRL